MVWCSAILRQKARAEAINHKDRFDGTIGFPGNGNAKSYRFEFKPRTHTHTHTSNTDE